MRYYRIDKRWLTAVLALGVTLFSCAKRESEDITRLEQKSLDAWVEKYVRGQGIDVVRQSSGVWVEFIEDGDQSNSATAAADTTVWVALHYTSTDIEGNVFSTRDSVVALRQRTFSPYTHYVPEYIYCDEYNSWKMPPGQHFALRSELEKTDGSTVKLTRGAHVRLYIPSYLAYGTGIYTNDQGYGGQYPLGRTKIVVQDLVVEEVVKNPLTHEETLVQELATEQWGKAVTDTLAPGFYIDTVNFHPSAALLADFPNKSFVKEYGLTVDSTARVWYVGKFLPSAEYPEGFIFDTNIPSVYETFYNRRAGDNYRAQDKTLEVLSYKPVDDQEKYIAAWYRAIPELRRGQWSRIVFPSAYGYGTSGKSQALMKQQQQMNQLASLYAYSSMLGSMGGGYGGGYGYGGYGSSYGYGGYGYGYNPFLDGSTSSTEEEETSVMTEIQPYTPLVFEIYIETGDDK